MQAGAAEFVSRYPRSPAGILVIRARRVSLRAWGAAARSLCPALLRHKTPLDGSRTIFESAPLPEEAAGWYGLGPVALDNSLLRPGDRTHARPLRQGRRPEAALIPLLLALPRPGGLAMPARVQAMQFERAIVRPRFRLADPATCFCSPGIEAAGETQGNSPIAESLPATRLIHHPREVGPALHCPS